jgi:uracil-DNA glycosylase family 4
MKRFTSLAELHSHYANTNTCALKETATQAVYGKGSASAKIVFIGEAPGKNEDKAGEPFIGASGKFLNEMLARVNLKRDDIYITNIVKYRPPENRDPSPVEIAACEEWLHAELTFIQPQVIVTLGRYSLNHFVPGVKISEAHGQVFKADIPGMSEQTFFALYHPAAALYNGSMRTVLLEDFAKIQKLLK